MKNRIEVQPLWDRRTFQSKVLRYMTVGTTSLTKPLTYPKYLNGRKPCEPYDKVECIFCKGSIQRWDVGDDDDEDPATLHDYAFPYCSNASPTLARPIPNFNTFLRYEPKPGFIRIYQTSTEARKKSFDHRWYDRNFPVQDLAESGFVYVTDQKIRCVYCYVYIDCQHKETDPYASHERCSPRCNSLFKIKKYMGYYEHRLIRLDSYPECISLDVKRIIARAGLYFADFYNVMKCFCCEKSMHIDLEEDIWHQHAFLSPTCEYVIYIKGQAYVNKVIAEGRYPKNDKILNYLTDESLISTISKTLSQEIERLSIENRVNGCCGENGQCNAKLCSVCLDKERNILHMPCRHFSTCSICTDNLTECPICKSHITENIQVYFS